MQITIKKDSSWKYTHYIEWPYNLSVDEIKEVQNAICEAVYYVNDIWRQEAEKRHVPNTK